MPRKQKAPKKLLIPKALAILTDLLRDDPLESDMTPSAIVKKYWNLYTSPRSRFKRSNSLDGKFFEELIILVLEVHDIFPVFVQGTIAFNNTDKHDLIVFVQGEGPVVLSAKTSLRERWRGANNEGRVLKGAHPRAKYYLLNVEHNETRLLRNHSEDLTGIDSLILADTEELDMIITFLKNSQLVESPIVQVVSSKRLITERRVSLLDTTLTEYPQVAVVLP